MSYAFRLVGKVTVKVSPAVAAPSVELEHTGLLDEQLELAKSHYTMVHLGDDAAEAVATGDLTGASCWLIRRVGGTGVILARLTHADGTAQVVPVDPVVLGVSAGSPITAITLQRAAGVEAWVSVLLGEATT